MAIETTIARHYAWRNIIFAVVCLVLGLWGVYDYAYSIPKRARNFERGELCRAVKNALEPEGWGEFGQEARGVVAGAIDRILKDHMDPAIVAEIEGDALRTADEETLAARAKEFQRAIESIRENQEEQWLVALVLFDQALKAGQPTHYPLTGVHLLAHEIATRGANALADVSPVSTYDRPTQWLFILCLPFVPWSLWNYFRTKSRVYRLDDDGTLHLPGETWSHEDIADIKMERWMSKSIAEVVHSNGKRVALDDYKHKDLYLIVGSIASRLYPEKWTPEAKPVKNNAGGQNEQGAVGSKEAEAEPEEATNSAE